MNEKFADTVTPGTEIALRDSEGVILAIMTVTDTPIQTLAVEAAGLEISGNTVSDCGNGGILVHRWQQAEDGRQIRATDVEHQPHASLRLDRGLQLVLRLDLLASHRLGSDTEPGQCGAAGE